MSQDALGKQGRLVGAAAPTGVEAYARELLGGALAVGLLNRGGSRASAALRWAGVGALAGKTVTAMRDLWAKHAVPITGAGLEIDVAAQDTALLRLETTRSSYLRLIISLTGYMYARYMYAYA